MTYREHSARGDPRPSQTFGPQYPYADLDAPTAHYARRFHDCQAVDEALGMARTHIQHLERRERDLSRALAHAEETARQVQEQLIQANGELERRLATATNDLANLRSFTVDSADAQGSPEKYEPSPAEQIQRCSPRSTTLMTPSMTLASASSAVFPLLTQ